MSVAATRAWIEAHKRQVDAVARWDGALEQTRVCAAEAARAAGDGFARANIYYNCRKGKLTPPGLFGLFIT